MTNSRAKGKLVLLDSYKSPSTAATYTYTPPMVLTGLKYDHLIVHIIGGATAALALELILNGTTSGYEHDIILKDTTTVTGERNTATSEIEIMPATIIDTGGRAFDIYIKLSFNLANSQVCVSWIGGAPGEGMVIGSGMLATSQISSIEIETSTSTWKANTTIKTYGVYL